VADISKLANVTHRPYTPRKRTSEWGKLAALLLVLSLGVLPFVTQAQPHQQSAPAFADPAFQSVWQRTDKPVADGSIKRGFYWGPQPGETKTEQYAEGQGGARLVQYFDKSRMEVNNPAGDKKSPFYVTNGLLSVELVTGKLQVGDNKYVVRSPAEIPLPSDTDDPTAPTYATFAKLLGKADNKLGTAQVSQIDRAGNITVLSDTTSTKQRIAHYEPQTGHNIPQVFWDYLNQSAPVWQDGKLVTAPLNRPWFYATGYPISDPYLAVVKIAGQQGVKVFIQAYQRRVLTYVPTAPDGFQVQVGNIGRHYYNWRYNNSGKPIPTPTKPAQTTPTPLPTLGPTGLSVFAASSLKESFTEAGKNFKAAQPNVSNVLFNFQGSQALVAQLQQGAPADVFASADKANMDKAVQAGVIDGSPRELTRNLLAVVLPNDNPGNVRSLADLARPGVKISLADPSVPVGNYSVQVLDKLSADPAYGANFKQKVLDNVVSREDNVRQVLTRVQLGEVDAGIVYITDAMAANAGATGSVPPVKTLEIADRYNVIAIYYIAPVKGAAHPQAAQAWITYILSDAGQAVLQKYGFSK
jgi:molybdenum ABC transporter molybdate-binding protein